MERPIYSDIAQTGALAVTYIQSFVEKKGWIFRRGEGGTDFGIDAEIEIVDKNKVTGHLIKIQVKGTAETSFQNNKESVTVKVSTWNNWKEVNLPVICLLCDISKKHIYWCLPLGFEPKEKAETITLTFNKENCLNFSFSQFNAIINTWLETFPKRNILLEVPFFHNLFTDTLEGLIDWGDPWCGAGEEATMQARVFYQHVLELRSSVGLTNDQILPYQAWQSRNQGMWDEIEMYHGGISELLFYIGHYYKEAFQKLVARLEKVPESFENNDILDYCKSRGIIKKDISYWGHPNQNSPSFHTMIEAELNKIGYTKFKWQGKK